MSLIFTLFSKVTQPRRQKLSIKGAEIKMRKERALSQAGQNIPTIEFNQYACTAPKSRSRIKQSSNI